MMKYTVTINEAKRTITVDLDGYKGVAKCCPTDHFDIRVGTELALERAKVAKKNATAKPATKKIGLMEAVKLVEALLPKGNCVVIGNGEELTKRNKEWLHSLTDCKGVCSCDEAKEAVKLQVSKWLEDFVGNLTDAVIDAISDTISDAVSDAITDETNEFWEAVSEL